MLELIRKYSSSLGVKILLTVLALTFVFCFGISDIIRKITGKDYVVKIGNIKISQEMFKIQKAKKRNQLSQLDTKIDESSLNALILNEFIVDNVISCAAKGFGFVISDSAVENYIRSMPFFRDQSGHFNPNILRGVLQKMRVSEEVFLEDSRKSLKTALIQAPIQFVLCAHEADLYVDADLEKRTIDVVELDPESFKITDTPTPDDLKEFYEEHQEDYMVDEQRSLRVVELSESTVAKDVSVSEDEIKEAYDFSSEKDDRSYESMKDDLKAELLQEKVQSRVDEVTRQIEDSLMSGEDFAEVIKKFNLKSTAIKDVKLVDKNAVANIPYGEDVLTVAFSVDDGCDSSFSEALDSNKNRVLWLVHVDNITPRHVEEFSKVAAKVRTAWVKNKQHEKAVEVGQELVEKIKAGKLIKTVASESGYACKTTEAFDRRGIVDAKKEASDIVSNLYKDVFAMAKGDVCSKELSGKVVVYQLSKVINTADVTESQKHESTKELSNSMHLDIWQQIYSFLTKRHGVHVNNEMLKEMNSEPSVPVDELF